LKSVFSKKTLLFGLFVSIVIAVDQATKFLVVNRLSPGESSTIIPGFLKITHVKNPGAAFGLFSGASWLVYPFSIFLIVATLFWFFVMRPEIKNPHVFGLALLFSGAVGNMIDRISRGKVVDFIDFGWWPVFNIADIAIVSGAIILVVLTLRGYFGRNN